MCADFDFCNACHTAFAVQGNTSIHIAGHTFRRQDADLSPSDEQLAQVLSSTADDVERALSHSAPERPESAAQGLAVGMRVRVQGLSKSPQYNDLVGAITGEGEGGRWAWEPTGA